MSILKEFITNVILEGKLEQESTMISRLIMSVIRKYIDTERLYHGLRFSIGPEIMKVKGVKRISVTVDLSRKGSANPVVSGSYIIKKYESEGVMFITITASHLWEKNSSKAKKQLSRLVAPLKGTIRHELEHSVQDFKKGSNDGDLDTYEKIIDYYTDPYEVDAFAAELYKKAKMTKRTFSSVVEKFLKEISEDAKYSGISLKDIERAITIIRGDIADAAKKRFPKAKFAGKKYKDWK